MLIFLALGTSPVFGAPQGGADVYVAKLLRVIPKEAWIVGSAPTPEALKGHVIVIDYFAYWCPPCRANAPYVAELARRNKDVVFLGIHSGLNVEGRNYIRTLNSTFPVVMDGAEVFKDAFFIQNIPNYILIDQNGKLRFAGPFDMSTLATKLKQLVDGR